MMEIDRVVFELMGKSSRSVRTRSRTVAKPYQFVCNCPFHDDWKLPDTSQKADAVSVNLFEVLSAIKQMPVLLALWTSPPNLWALWTSPEDTAANRNNDLQHIVATNAISNHCSQHSHFPELIS